MREESRGVGVEGRQLWKSVGFFLFVFLFCAKDQVLQCKHSRGEAMKGSRLMAACVGLTAASPVHKSLKRDREKAEHRGKWRKRVGKTQSRAGDWKERVKKGKSRQEVKKKIGVPVKKKNVPEYKVWKRNKSRMKTELKKPDNFRAKMCSRMATQLRRRMFVGQNLEKNKKTPATDVLSGMCWHAHACVQLHTSTHGSY